MMQPGPRNLITDVGGLAVGNAADRQAWTGVTVLLPDRPVTAAVDVRGGGPGTRETEALDPVASVTQIHGLVLSGGSVFGLAAADEVALWLAARGRGLTLGGMTVPVVPAAILFDLLNGGDKGWARPPDDQPPDGQPPWGQPPWGQPPYRQLARAACDSADLDFGLGTAGAGYGAKAGRLKGGLGSASIVTAEGLAVGALVAVNPHGHVVQSGSEAFWAAPFALAGELGDQPALPGPALVDDPDLHAAAGLPLASLPLASPGANTTIAVVATNASLDKAACRRVAIMAQDGLSRAIRPVHTPFDGDVVFALATGERANIAQSLPLISRVGALAADCLARAIARGVYEATSLGRWPAWRGRAS